MTKTKDKSTEELENEIKAADDMDEYLIRNSDLLLRQSVSETLNDALSKTDMLISQVVKRSGLTRSYVYHIFGGKRMPSRDKLIAIAFGLGLDCDETNALLKKCRFAQLYSKDVRDAVIMFNLTHRKDIFETNSDLEERGFEPLK